MARDLCFFTEFVRKLQGLIFSQSCNFKRLSLRIRGAFQGVIDGIQMILSVICAL